ncbi:MAG: transcriptional regulator, partial [Actinoplanes sp.]
MTRTDLLVLHTLRCVGHAALPRVADTTGLTRSEAESELIDLAVAGFVTRTAAEFGGWGLTPAGRAVDQQRIAAELEAAAARDTVAAAYQEFLVLNPELLELCTAWQMRQIGG